MEKKRAAIAAAADPPEKVKNGFARTFPAETFPFYTEARTRYSRMMFLFFFVSNKKTRSFSESYLISIYTYMDTLTIGSLVARKYRVNLLSFEVNPR